jgi:hypothetical protein
MHLIACPLGAAASDRFVPRHAIAVGWRWHRVLKSVPVGRQIGGVSKPTVVGDKDVIHPSRSRSRSLRSSSCRTTGAIAAVSGKPTRASFFRRRSVRQRPPIFCGSVASGKGFLTAAAHRRVGRLGYADFDRALMGPVAVSFKYAAAAAATRCHKGNNPNGKNILSLAAAIALCTATINTGATAAYRRGRRWVSGHFRSDFGHDTFSLGERPGCIFAPSLEPCGLGMWLAGWLSLLRRVGLPVRLHSLHLLYLRRWVTQGLLWCFLQC